jgi:hypothetical protein
VTVADTWDEAACRARLAVVASTDASVVACLSFSAHAPSDLRAALAEIDRLRAKLDEADGVLAAAAAAIVEQLNRAVAAEREIDRLRAALRPFAGFARSEMDPVRMPTVADFKAAAAALGGARD